MRLPEDEPACDPAYTAAAVARLAAPAVVTETLAEERARLAARIEAIDAEMVAAEQREWWLRGVLWSDYDADYARRWAYSVPVALRAELLAHVPERLRAALAEGFADRDGAR